MASTPREDTGWSAGLVAEFVLSLVFVFVIMGATDERAPKGLAPLAIGLTLALIHLICIPVTGTSVNPARSIGPAIFQGGWALSQLWVFLVAPLVGGAVGGILYHWLIDERKVEGLTRQIHGQGVLAGTPVGTSGSVESPGPRRFS